MREKGHFVLSWHGDAPYAADKNFKAEFSKKKKDARTHQNRRIASMRRLQV
jgi:hypothetical protein